MTYGLDYVAFTSAEWEWRSRGVCTADQDDTFFAEKGGEASAPAKQICVTQCPVAAQCLDYAIQSKYPVQGVWGGTTESERRKARARVHKKVQASPVADDGRPEMCSRDKHPGSRLRRRTENRKGPTGKRWAGSWRCLDCMADDRREKAAA